MQDITLISVTLVVDDEVGGAGEFDFALPSFTRDWFERSPNNRAKLANEMRELAARIEQGL